jgi:HTH-type transcriptional repressor of NAD biosynthesis genes
MRRGLVIGKFLPIHLGHVALINFASTRCDELIVSMSVAPSDTIAADLRFSWIQEIFNRNSKVKVHQVVDDFDDVSLSWEERTKIWAGVIRKTFPPVQVIFSSEEYGEPFARNLNAEHILFDLPRNQLPVSASLIRANPFQYWDYLPPNVMPYFVKKLCFFGPESTGKSMMAEILAKRYNTVFVPEVARELITSNDFTPEDIIRIGYAHARRVREKMNEANKVLFCDTDAITTQLYSLHYLNVIPEILFALEKEVQYDHYFLFDIDVQWVSDGLRDLGDRRLEMFLLFREALERRNIPYTLVQGDYQTRQQLIESWLAENFQLKAVN